MTKQEQSQLEIKIMDLENKREEMMDEACYVLAEILEKRIIDLKLKLNNTVAI